MDEVEDDVETPGEDEREEQGETCEVDIALRATRANEYCVRTVGGRDSLEFSCGEVGFGPDILHSLPACFSHIGFRSHAEHPLEGIYEQDTHESKVERDTRQSACDIARGHVGAEDEHE